MLPIILTVLVTVTVVNGQTIYGQTCLKANNKNGLPQLMDYRGRGSDLRSGTIPELHQVIIPSYRFTCCGNITEWGVALEGPGRGPMHDEEYTLHLQVWRPSPTVQTTGCYSLVGNNSFFSVSVTNQVASVTPSPQHWIQFQPGDVLGFSLKTTDRSDGGIVVLKDSGERDDGGYETEEVWYADTRKIISTDMHCVGSESGRVLNTRTNAAPVISVAYRSTMACPPRITPTVFNSASLLSTPSPMIGHGSDCSYNYKLITGVIVAGLVVAITTILTLILGFARYVKLHKHNVPIRAINKEDCSCTGIQDHTKHTERDAHDNPSKDDQVMESMNIKQNDAYATNAEAKQCVAYNDAANINTEKNDAYGKTFQDKILRRESNTTDYDYPAVPDV